MRSGQLLLSGPPGVGKSTTGRLLASSLELPFFDLDERLLEQTGRSTGQLLREAGEPEFRRRELESLRELPREPAVIALGGGTLTQRAAVQEARTRGILVGLRSELGALLGRLAGSNSDRPLLGDDPAGWPDRLRDLLRTREASYESVDVILDADRPAEELASALEGADGQLRWRTCQFGEHRTRILVGTKLASALVGAVRSLAPERTVVVLIDDGVPRELVLEGVEALRARFPVWEQRLAGGESCKTWSTLESVLEGALEAGAGRQSAVVGIGGGALLDLAALAGALLGRGAPVVLVPTTVLAQVDASVGGKCAINTRNGRNLVGSFHPASDVLVDLDFLSTLPEAEYRSGLVEVLKMGLISDAEFFRRVLREPVVRVEVAAHAIDLKCRIVERDPRERGERMLLNLGHTVGHALESASDYTIPHGTAVAWGLLAAAEVSTRYAGLSEAEASEIREGISPYLSSPPAAEVWSRALSHLRQDKKGNRDGVEFVALSRIGEAVRRRVSWSEVEGAWEPFGGASR